MFPFMPQSMPSGKTQRFLEKKVWGPTFNILKPKRKKKLQKIPHEPSNAAIGKRHACESYTALKARRKICNAKRRQREKERRHHA